MTPEAQAALDELDEEIDVLIAQRDTLVKKLIVPGRKRLIEMNDLLIQMALDWRETMEITADLQEGSIELMARVRERPELPTHGVVTHYTVPGKHPIVHFYTEDGMDRRTATNAARKIVRDHERNLRDENVRPDGVMKTHAVQIMKDLD